MTRQQRRQMERMQRSGKVQTLSSVYTYRVRRHFAAITFDVEGFDPSTVEVRQANLVELVDAVGEALNGQSYWSALQMFGSSFYLLKSGGQQAWSFGVLGWWLAFHHPRGGTRMRAAVSAAMATSAPVHVTMHVSRSGGVGFALADRFHDLAAAMEIAKQSAVGLVISQDRGPRAAVN